MKIIALGMGVQSSCLYLMSSMGEFERADHAVFSDPMSEHPKTYKFVKWLLNWQKENNGIPIHINKNNIAKDLLNPREMVTKPNNFYYPALPMFFESNKGTDAIGRRQCTAKYKIEPTERKVRELMGLKKNQRWTRCEFWLGISIDEAQRMKDSGHNMKINRYPLMEMMMSRQDCINWFKEKEFNVPYKSSCVFCPFHSNKQWIEMKKSKKVWKNIVKIDKALRNRKGDYYKNNTLKGYLHSSQKPIDEVDFNENQMDLFDGFGNECEGHCGI